MRIRPRLVSRLYACARPLTVDVLIFVSQFEPSTVRNAGSVPAVRAKRSFIPSKEIDQFRVGLVARIATAAVGSEALEEGSAGIDLTVAGGVVCSGNAAGVEERKLVGDFELRLAGYGG